MNQRIDPNETFTIKQYEKDGIKYHDEMPARYKDWKILFPIYKFGDLVLGSMNMVAMDNLKYDYPIKFTYDTLHNEGVKIPVAKPVKPTPHFTYEDEIGQQEPVEYIDGITTKIEHFNPTFTAQVKLYPNNWGEPRKLMILKGYDEKPVPQTLTLDDWKKQYDSFEYFMPNLSETEIAMLTTKPTYELREILFDILKNAKYNYWTGAFVQILFNLPTIEYTREPIYEEAPEMFTSSVPLKNVDIDYEIIGEDLTVKGKITAGSYMRQCNVVTKDLRVGQNKARYYTIQFDVLPFIYDWFNVPMPEEKKKKRFLRRGED